MVTNAWDHTTREIGMKINQVLLQLLIRFALGHVIWKFIQMSKPHFTILPIRESKFRHKGIYIPTSLIFK